MATATNGASKSTTNGSLPQSTSIWHDDATEDEEEWEYEYHETEVEHLYITLDLSDVAVSVQPKSKPTTKESSTNRRENSDRADDDAEDEASDADDDDSQHTPREKVRIMELHGANPIVSYAGKVYSCRWASSLGTDMFFANVVDTFEMDIDALRSGIEYDLIGMSAAKLVATNAEIKPRASKSNADDRLVPEHANGRPLYILSSASSLSYNDDRRSQMRFLERLNHVKARRQEVDKIPTGLFKPSQEFMDKYSTKHIPTGEESEDDGPLVGGTQLPLTMDGVRAKPGVRRRAKRGDHTLHGDSSNLLALLEAEMQKPTPMTLPKFRGSGVKLVSIEAQEAAGVDGAAGEEGMKGDDGSEEDSDEGDDDLLHDDEGSDEDDEDEDSADDSDGDNEELPGTSRGT